MKSILKKTFFVGMVAVMGFATISFPIQNYASAESTIINNSSINMIKQTDNELIYELENNEEILRYEEQIKENNNVTQIETKVYKMIDGKKELVSDSKKEIIKTESQVEFIKNNGESLVIGLDELNTNTNETTVNTVPESRMYSSWVESSIPGINLGYRRDLWANYGDARYGTMVKKKVRLNNVQFDTFKSKVDDLKSRESSFFYEATAINALGLILEKGVKGWSLADIVTLLRKFAVPANVIWNVGSWLLDYNSATDVWNDIPARIEYGCNWSC